MVVFLHRISCKTNSHPQLRPTGFELFLSFFGKSVINILTQLPQTEIFCPNVKEWRILHLSFGYWKSFTRL